MIRPIGFLDTAQLSAGWTVKYKERASNGVLKLRDIDPDDVMGDSIIDTPVVKEWKAANAILKRIKSQGAQQFGGRAVELGKAWIEVLPGGHGTPWTVEEDDYAQSVVRTRTCLVPAPDAYTCSGVDRIILNVGWLHHVEHRLLHSEVNFGTFGRVHLIVDVKIPEPEEAA